MCTRKKSLKKLTIQPFGWQFVPVVDVYAVHELARVVSLITSFLHVRREPVSIVAKIIHLRQYSWHTVSEVSRSPHLIELFPASKRRRYVGCLPSGKTCEHYLRPELLSQETYIMVVSKLAS